MFMIVDLFRNVEEFDAIRPRSSLYRGMQIAAHKMVGEPVLDSRFRVAPALLRARARPDASDAFAHVPPGRRRLEELKQLGREGSFEPLRAALTDERNPRMRVAAMRVLAENFGADARDVLLARVHDHRETEWVRAEAAHFVGWTGPEAYDALEEIVRSRWPDPIRAGALRGLGRSGSAAAVERALACADENSPPLHRAARAVFEQAVDPKAVPLLLRVAEDSGRSEALRVAACRGLGRTRTREAVESLTALLVDRAVAEPVRVAAVEGLSRTSDPKALRAVSKHCDDPSRAVASAARHAELVLARSQSG
jgi:HEAT repeat protein